VVHLFWDASALAKRFVGESGSQTVNALFAAVPSAQMVTTISSYSETFAALLRKHNQGVLSAPALSIAQAALRNEIIDDPCFTVLGIDFDDFLDALDLIKRHNLNSSDATLLRAFLRHTHVLGASPTAILVATDQRLLRAAGAEGMHVLNPEIVVDVDATAFLAAL
jgi:predicted nucleic acid-binding protein